MRSSQSFTKTKLYKGTKLQVDNFAQRQNCTRRKSFTKKILHGGLILHKIKNKNTKKSDKKEFREKKT